jgi:broad specificity phosphatase PhoE
VTRFRLYRHPAPGGSLQVQGDVVYASDLDRARNAVPDPKLDPRLREIDRGDAEGLEFDDLPAELQRGLLEEPLRVRFPGGENYEELRARVMAALDELAARHPDETVAVVTHAGAIRAALATWLLLPDEAVFRIELDFSSVTVVDLNDGTPLVRLVNGPA